MAVLNEYDRGHWGNCRINAWLFLSHPATCLLYLIGLATLTFLYQHPLFSAVNLVCMLLLAIYSLGVQFVLDDIKVKLMFCSFVALFSTLLNHRGSHIIFYLFDSPMTWESLAYSGYLILLFVSMFTFFLMINLILGSEKILYLFSCTIPQTGLIISMTLRFSSLMRKQIAEYAMVQKNRNGNRQSNRWPTRIKQAAVNLGGFVSLALEGGLQTAEHLRANEYGSGKRTLYLAYRFGCADLVFLFVIIGCVSACIFFRASGAGQFDYFRGDVYDLRLLGYDKKALFLMIIYYFLPIAVDCLEWIKGKINCL